MMKFCHFKKKSAIWDSAKWNRQYGIRKSGTNSSSHKPEMSMLRSCPNRLEFKNECYSTVNQLISKLKNIDICINFMGRTKTKPFLKRKKVPGFGKMESAIWYSEIWY
jgi:hypothetical protein